MNQEKRALYLLRPLLEEMPEYAYVAIPTLHRKRWQLLRSLANVRPPMPVCKRDSRMALGQGNITTLRCDGVVNAANSALPGCCSPCHGCTDDMICTMSGVQLRRAFHGADGNPGPCRAHGAGQDHAGLQPALQGCDPYPGPVVDGPLARERERLLASCDRSCLKIADQNGCGSISFCCIATGVSMFPKRRAGEIAVQTVRTYYEETGREPRLRSMCSRIRTGEYMTNCARQT